MANLPPVSVTPVAIFSTLFASVVDTGGKFAAGVNNGINIRLQTPYSELEGKNVYIC